MATLQRIVPCLWMDNRAEEAATFYTGIFKNSKVGATTRYTEAGREIHGHEPGSVMTVEIELDGQSYTVLNGGPMFKFSEAVSFQVMCETQEEIDYYWERLSAGGDPDAQQCGWVKDRFGLSWQIVPSMLSELLRGSDPEKATRVLDRLMEMKKLDIAALRDA